MGFFKDLEGLYKNVKSLNKDIIKPTAKATGYLFKKFDISLENQVLLSATKMIDSMYNAMYKDIMHHYINIAEVKHLHKLIDYIVYENDYNIDRIIHRIDKSILLFANCTEQEAEEFESYIERAYCKQIALLSNISNIRTELEKIANQLKLPDIYSGKVAKKFVELGHHREYLDKFQSIGQHVEND